MDYISNSTTGIIEKLGKSFLIVGYLPALMYVLVHYIILFPLWLGSPLNAFTNQPGPQTSDLTILQPILIILITPLGLGILILAMNSIIIRIYEGRPWILQKVILKPLQHINTLRCHRHYGEIVVLKSKLRETLQKMEQENNRGNRIKYQQEIDALAMQIEKAFEQLEIHEIEQRLPLRPARVAPTALGNIFAIMEEYPFDRYGIDSVLLWTRLRPLLDKTAPEQAERLTNQKIVLDMTLNLSMLSGLIAVESAITMWLYGYNATLMVVITLSLILFWLYYQAALLATRTLGNIVMTCFDFYRGLVLDQFGIATPVTLAQEQVTWLKIAAFLRRGEPFYWPEKKQTEISSEKEAGKHGQANN